MKLNVEMIAVAVKFAEFVIVTDAVAVVELTGLAVADALPAETNDAVGVAVVEVDVMTDGAAAALAEADTPDTVIDDGTLPRMIDAFDAEEYEPIGDVVDVVDVMTPAVTA